MMTTKLIARLLVAATLTAAAATGTAFAQTEAAMAGAAKTGTATNDDAITSKIKASLADQKQIGVTTTDGVVVLSGSVASTDIGTKAIQVASAVPGVKEVKSELTVASK
ncbi:BON domain-containing protein [Duganella violaceipulchra]|uniref:BON domain-containing protein n=1 Tax=Duganella violaceipulchra TaxID=2849652 RepID=A0AA41L7B3_9BURK|nr:BON domain-containing protein [Duganella violaceicalia]MBV6321025.1 BON domain-containing protein [Duganella violaceicalia]MCP2009729.1 hyperosmotically inducible protein [Duganella violaceicalia]